MLQVDIIGSVHEPKELCSPIVVVPKADDRIRICVDLAKRNQAVVEISVISVYQTSE